MWIANCDGMQYPSLASFTFSSSPFSFWFFFIFSPLYVRDAKTTAQKIPRWTPSSNRQWNYVRSHGLNWTINLCIEIIDSLFHNLINSTVYLVIYYLWFSQGCLIFLSCLSQQHHTSKLTSLLVILLEIFTQIFV